MVTQKFQIAVKLSKNTLGFVFDIITRTQRIHPNQRKNGFIKFSKAYLNLPGNLFHGCCTHHRKENIVNIETDWKQRQKTTQINFCSPNLGQLGLQILLSQ